MKSIIIGLGLLVVVGLIAAYGASKKPSPAEQPNTPSQLITYQDKATGISFSYPASWGPVETVAGNPTCPEEDTYRTPETLSIYDRELRFKDIDLPNSESIIRTGIRFYHLNPDVSNNCNDDVLRKLAKQEMTGEEFSSFRLTPVTIDQLYGVYNEQASRLDTEGREQYTLFFRESTLVLTVQPYMSFIPYAASPEWEEIDKNYRGDMASYLDTGKTASQIRTHFEVFRQLTKSIRYK